MVRAFKATETVSTEAGDFTLAIDIAIIDALEDEFDLAFDELLGQLRDKARVGRMSRLMRALLSRHHPGLTLDEVGALIMDNGEQLGIGMERLFAKAQPDAEEQDIHVNPPKPRRGTGANSSSRGVKRASRRANTGSRHLELSS